MNEIEKEARGNRLIYAYNLYLSSNKQGHFLVNEIDNKIFIKKQEYNLYVFAKSGYKIGVRVVSDTKAAAFYMQNGIEYNPEHLLECIKNSPEELL